MYQPGQYIFGGGSTDNIPLLFIVAFIILVFHVIPILKNNGIRNFHKIKAPDLFWLIASTLYILFFFLNL